MGNFASLHIATIGGALLWPLAAGVAIVAWSKVRAGAHARRLAAMELQLQGFYRTLESKPIPPNLAMVVDALQEGEELAGTSVRSKTATPAGS